MGNGLTRDEVQSFLEQFHLKVRVFGILFRDDRGKNQKTLEELDISFHLAEAPMKYPFK
mgnify:CR=1 FL=1